ncbi:GlxA family transcriptional regulator [Mycobacterium sp. Aquia_216]|uniref:GlxA family transcriptional regulator n=1 Tax=Mycobacterium sp. Aquia_216 TaxID=2991729 RepID=UPI00227B0C9A|nr:GlxA family transcriptional regulator [Mycobacterium sp. Aquia_216]WAJ43030.1 GlxA family transcriptional regulator [Mycobacterium sp. Aquia_216]
MTSTHLEQMRRRTVVIAIYDKVTLQDVAAPLEIFARANDFGANYEVLLISPEGRPVATTAFTRLAADRPLARAPRTIDILLVPGGVPGDFYFTPGTHDIPEEITPDHVPDALNLVRQLAVRSKRVASVCTGAFILAELGLLDGRRATTHWAHCTELAERYSGIDVDPDALFVEDGRYITGAGISSGTDLALALVENDFGTDVARRVARWLVVFMQRPGGQAQFSVWNETGAPTTTGLREALDAVALNPAGDHTVPSLAARVSVSERHLTRLFRDEVGMTPARYVEQTRLEAAKVLLVREDLAQEIVARRSGFRSAEAMRRSFRRNLGISPSAYRARFRTTGAARNMAP